jgi:hypothetical protein
MSTSQGQTPIDQSNPVGLSWQITPWISGLAIGELQIEA